MLPVFTVQMHVMKVQRLDRRLRARAGRRGKHAGDRQPISQ
jgi:hypothetical protein